MKGMILLVIPLNAETQAALLLAPVEIVRQASLLATHLLCCRRGCFLIHDKIARV